MEVGAEIDGVWQVAEALEASGPVARFRARHRELPELRAEVRVFPAVGDDALATWTEAADRLARVSCDALPRAFAHGTLDGAPYLVTEEVVGETLPARLDRRGPLSVDEARALSEKLAEALQVARAHGVTHRSLAPGQLVFVGTGDGAEELRLTGFEPWPDFGAEALRRPTDVRYAAPEVIRGESGDDRSDVYTMSAILYQSLTGAPPFDDDSEQRLLVKITGPELPPAMRERNRAVPPECDQLVRAGLAARPEDRPESVSELCDRLVAELRRGPVDDPRAPTATVGRTQALSTVWVSGVVSSPLWRGRGEARDRLRFAAPAGGFAAGEQGPRELALDPDRSPLHVGSSPTEHNGITNDLVLPHKTVSRAAIELARTGGRWTVRRLGRAKVWVGLQLLAQGEAVPVIHGESVAVGKVVGVFLDGRFVPPQAPAESVDARTGLLGREGLAWELSLAGRLGKTVRLLIATPRGASDDPEAISARVAMAIHDAEPRWPVARFDRTVAAVAPADAELDPIGELAERAAAVPLTIGFRELVGGVDEIGARLDEVRAALSRLAERSAPSGVVDLGQHTVAERTLDDFAADARALARVGGQVALLAFEDAGRVASLGGDIMARVDDELLHVASRLAGSGAVVAPAADGVIALATPGPVEAVARRIAADWHARGPIRGEVVEVERSLAVEPVDATDLDRLAQRAGAFAAVASAGLGVEALPAPIAVAQRAVERAATTADRGRALVELVATTRRLLSIVLDSLGRWWGPVTGGVTSLSRTVSSESDTLDPKLGGGLAGAPGRVGELMRPLFHPGGRSLPEVENAARLGLELAQALAADPPPPDLEARVRELDLAVRALLGALRPLRGWTLISVDRVVARDPMGEHETVYYIDHTGSYPAGTARSVALMKSLRMGPFVYLARFGDGLVVPLEPLMRRRYCKETARSELFWITDAPRGPGRYGFAAVFADARLTEEVSEHSLRAPDA
jgi:serine/threonine protein kinase